MNLKEKIEKAKRSNWLSEGFTDSELKEIVESAKSKTNKTVTNRCRKR